MAISRARPASVVSRDLARNRRAAHAEDRPRIAPCRSYDSDSHQYSSNNRRPEVSARTRVGASAS